MVVVPAALQFQIGDVAKFAVHVAGSTLTAGGSDNGVHTHLLPVQSSPATQSVPVTHALPVAHFGQPPPQSTSVSVPSFMLFAAQIGSVHTLAMQFAFWQSAGPPQPWPAGHFGQVPPPQSTPVSAAFFTLSVHVGFWQTFAMQFAAWQSPFPLHALPWS